MSKLAIALTLLVGAPVASVGVGVTAPALVRADDDVEVAGASSLAPITLPGGAHRSTSKRDLTKFEDMLQKTARTNHGRMARIEVLIWRGGEAWAAMKNLPDRLKEAGYNYVSFPAFDSEPGRVTPLAGVRKGEKDGLLGMWIETKDGGYVLLAWGHYTPDNPDNPGHPVGTKPAAAERPAIPAEPPTTTEDPVAAPMPNEPEPAATPEAPMEVPAVAEPEPTVAEPDKPAAPAPEAAAPAKPRAAAATKAPAKASRPSAKKPRVASQAKNTKTKSKGTPSSDPFKKLNDYNYVKYFGPISGPMYSSKW